MEKRFEAPIVVAALLVIPVIVLEETSTSEPWDTIAIVANWLIWLVFALELAVMLSVVPNRRAWLRAHLLDRSPPGTVSGGRLRP
jgi:voltage-gated potassium channel